MIFFFGGGVNFSQHVQTNVSVKKGVIWDIRIHMRVVLFSSSVYILKSC